MPYKNVKELLVDATKLPVAIEAKLPAGAPTISTMLVDVAGKIPVVPDFFMEIPDLPAVPELPALPELPAGPEGLTRYVSGVTVTPVGNTIKKEIIPSPAVGVIPEVRTRRGM
ncbi:hypothetical protein ES703_00343 [subsurface metagenome]